MFGGKHKLEHCDCWLMGKEKKSLVDWNLKLQRKRKRQTARERKKMKLAFSSGPSLDDQSLLLEPLTFFFFFFWEERFALPHKSLSKHTNTHPQIICHHHLSAGWRTVGARNIVTVWTNSPNISDVRHRYENTHIKARACVCVCVCVTPPVASTLTSQLDPPPPPPPHLALTKYTCWASSSAVL